MKIVYITIASNSVLSSLSLAKYLRRVYFKFMVANKGEEKKNQIESETYQRKPVEVKGYSL